MPDLDPNHRQADDFSRQFLATYSSLRMMLVIIGFALPWVLGVGGYALGGFRLAASMSAYYHARLHVEDGPASIAAPAYSETRGMGVMRDWFVGSLFAIAVLLIVYRGFTPSENRALNCAGIFALGVALFPTDWPKPQRVDEHFDLAAALTRLASGISIHYVCAVSFFICIAFVCIFQAPRTLSLIRDPRRKRFYRRLYRTLGHLMWISPVIAVVINAAVQGASTVFFLEAVPVYIFSTYWLFKSREIAETHADSKAVCGEVLVPERTSWSEPLPEVQFTAG